MTILSGAFVMGLALGQHGLALVGIIGLDLTLGVAFSAVIVGLRSLRGSRPLDDA